MELMQTNSAIVSFFRDNFLLLIVLLLFLVRIVPPDWAGFWKYNNNREQDGNAPRITLLRLFFHNILDSIWGTTIINIIACLKETMVTFIVFGALGFDIFFRRQISREAIILVCVGVIVLYLELLIKTGKHIKLFGGFMEWEKEDYGQVNQTPYVSTIPTVPQQHKRSKNGKIIKNGHVSTP